MLPLNEAGCVFSGQVRSLSMASSHFSHGSFEDLFVRDGAGDERRGSRQRHEEHSGQHAQFLFRPRASWRMVTVFSAGESQSESGCFERGASWSFKQFWITFTYTFTTMGGSWKYLVNYNGRTSRHLSFELLVTVACVYRKSLCKESGGSAQQPKQ
jgi:hypothetical protein